MKKIKKASFLSVELSPEIDKESSLSDNLLGVFYNSFGLTIDHKCLVDDDKHVSFYYTPSISFKRYDGYSIELYYDKLTKRLSILVPLNRYSNASINKFRELVFEHIDYMELIVATYSGLIMNPNGSNLLKRVKVTRDFSIQSNDTVYTKFGMHTDDYHKNLFNKESDNLYRLERDKYVNEKFDDKSYIKNNLLNSILDKQIKKFVEDFNLNPIKVRLEKGNEIVCLDGGFFIAKSTIKNHYVVYIPFNYINEESYESIKNLFKRVIVTTDSYDQSKGDLIFVLNDKNLIYRYHVKSKKELIPKVKESLSNMDLKSGMKSVLDGTRAVPKGVKNYIVDGLDRPDLKRDIPSTKTKSKTFNKDI